MKQLGRNLTLCALLLGVAASAAGCATSLCERKEKWLASHCVGGDVTWSHDATCETAIKSCGPGHLAQFEGYVACLESQNVCSLDSMNVCAQQYPGGVNLSCPAQN